MTTRLTGDVMVDRANTWPLVASVMFVGALVTLFHEYLYARIEDHPHYHLLNLISHGGIDMVLATLASSLTVAVYVLRTRTR